MRIGKIQNSIIQAFIFLLMIAGFLYLYVSVMNNFSQRNIQAKHKQQSMIWKSNSNS